MLIRRFAVTGGPDDRKRDQGVTQPWLSKPAELVELRDAAVALINTLDQEFGIPDPYPLPLVMAQDGQVAAAADRTLVALTMRDLHRLRHLATPGVETRVDTVVELCAALNPALRTLAAASTSEPLALSIRTMRQMVIFAGGAVLDLGPETRLR